MVGAEAWLVGLVWFVGLLSLCYAGRDRLQLCLHIRRVFILFSTCVPAIQESQKLVEFISNNSYHYC